KNGSVVVHPADRGRPVEVAIEALHQPANGTSSIPRRADKGVKSRIGAAGIDPKDSAASLNAIAAHPAELGLSVEIAIAALHKPGSWLESIVWGANKRIKIRVAPGRADPKHGATAEGAISPHPSSAGRAVEIAVAALY